MRDKRDKTNTDDIDEEFLLATFRDDDIDPAKEKTRKDEEHEKKEQENRKGASSKSRRKKGNINYGGEFFKRNEFKSRQNVYISQKNHAIISKIIRTVGDSDMSVGGYIDLIITEHLEHYEEEILEAFRKWKEKETNSLSDLI